VLNTSFINLFFVQGVIGITLHGSPNSAFPFLGLVKLGNCAYNFSDVCINFGKRNLAFPHQAATLAPDLTSPAINTQRGGDFTQFIPIHALKRQRFQ
jgi:hypothetical protein